MDPVDRKTLITLYHTSAAPALDQRFSRFVLEASASYSNDVTFYLGLKRLSLRSTSCCRALPHLRFGHITSPTVIQQALA